MILSQAKQLPKDPLLATDWAISDLSALSLPLLYVKDFNQSFSTQFRKEEKKEGWVHLDELTSTLTDI